MASKMYLKNKSVDKTSPDLLFFRKCTAAFFCLLLIILSGCVSTGTKNHTLDDSGIPEPEIIDQPVENTLVSDSRINASHSLTQDGYALLCRKDYDGAIRILERAVGVNPSDGPGYYYLAEAWIGKKNYKLAFQFNRLASIYLRENSMWTERTKLQKNRINEFK